MATVSELVPLFQEALYGVLAANPSAPDDVMYAIDRVRREWIMPEVSTSSGFTPPPPEPPDPPEAEAPTIASVDPASLTVGEGTDLTVTGTGFTDASVIKADGNPLATTFVSETELETFAPGPLAAGSVALTVTTGELTSAPHTLTAEAAARSSDRRKPEYGRDDDDDRPTRRDRR